MGLFKIGGTVMRALFGKPATAMYPVKPAIKMERSRGKLSIDIDDCIFCGSCQRICPATAIDVSKNEKTWEIDRFRCIICGRCAEVCPKKCLHLDNDYVKPTAIPSGKESYRQEKAEEPEKEKEHKPAHPKKETPRKE